MSGAEGWNPSQTLYFRGSSGTLTLDALDLLSIRLTGSLVGLYRPPAEDREILTGEGDFEETTGEEARLELSLLLRLQGPQATVPTVSGRLIVESAGLESSHGTSRIRMRVASGSARLFARDLPASDLSGQAFGHFLNIQPVFVVKDEPAAFESLQRLCDGAEALWRDAGIEILCGDPIPLPIGDAIATSLGSGDITPLVRLIRKEVPRGGGVPVAFVLPRFRKGGGATRGHGWEHAIVVVTEDNAGSSTLLAHELGHVLGGREAGSPLGNGYWVGESESVMDAPSDVAIQPPAQLCKVAKANAAGFARPKNGVARTLRRAMARTRPDKRK